MTEPQKQLVAAIDLGTTKVAAAVAEATGDPRHPSAKVLGIGVERTQGVRRGVVRDIEEATRAITKAMSAAQKMAGPRSHGLHRRWPESTWPGRTSHGRWSR
jgi:cell division protein FtsA